MSGSKTTQRTKQQQSATTTTAPWAPTTPLLNNMVSAAGRIPLTNPFVTNGITNTAQSVAALNPSILSAAKSLLPGGQINSMLNSAYGTSKGLLASANDALTPYLNPNFLDPRSNPYFAPELQNIEGQVMNDAKDAFASSGRFGPSGDFAKAIALGMSQGETPVLANQFNANAGLQQNAIGQRVNIANAGVSNALNTGTTEANMFNMVPGLTNSMYMPYMQANAAPWLPLSAASSFLTPIAQLGGQSTATSNSKGTTTQQTAQNPFMIAAGLLSGGAGLLG